MLEMHSDAWIGCGECDPVFRCWNGGRDEDSSVKCIRLSPPPKSTVAFNYIRIHEFVEKYKLPYNEVCAMIRASVKSVKENN